MAFMAAYYGRAGLVADAALLFNLFLIMGVLAQFSFALTLPGIAGLLLVIAASVDANVLIFERIREELDHGLMPKDAINKGYSRAFSAIFDANVTTLIIALILFIFGTGPVQNFAITLLIGVFTSFLSAVYVSRLIIEWMVKGKETTTLTFSTFLSRNLFKNLNFDIVGKRKIAYVFSTVFIVIGFVLMYLQGGPNLGVDFRGGRAYVVSFDKPVVASDAREFLTKDYFAGAGTEAKTFGTDNRLRITTGYLADDESVEADQKVKTALLTGLNAKYGALKPKIESTSKVGATIADDIKRTSVLSLGLTLLAIFVYVLFRFEKWQYSMAAVVALFHDALIVIASFPIARACGPELRDGPGIRGRRADDHRFLDERHHRDLRPNQGVPARKQAAHLRPGGQPGPEQHVLAHHDYVHHRVPGDGRALHLRRRNPAFVLLRHDYRYHLRHLLVAVHRGPADSRHLRPQGKGADGGSQRIRRA